ncbi:MAG TPA: hypothetical protein VMI31_13280, partial [Fimbriimonadaceae bacterium]|nr:hypothetical protein [Fimbriimonadaceae bacterium]
MSPPMDGEPSLFGQFPYELRDVLYAPEPLKTVMLRALGRDDEIDLLILIPDPQTGLDSPPAALLAIQPKGWMLATGNEPSGCRVLRATYGDTLFIELTRILLFGRLKIVYAQRSGAASAAIQFNAVMTHVMQRAIGLILDRMDGRSEIDPTPRVAGASNDRPGDPDEEVHAQIAALPIKFRSALATYRLGPRPILRVLGWN